MPHRILLTGASGYLGGSLLAAIGDANLPIYDKLYALVRTDAQAEAVKKYAAEPLNFDVKDEAAVRSAVVGHKITVVFFLIDAMSAVSQGFFIKSLAEVRSSTGEEVHFLHTTGAKLFSSHAGAPTDRLLLDDEADLYEIQKVQRAPVTPVQPAIEANCTVTEESLELGVCSYIFTPCIVYGKGSGFGNVTSIQTVAIVRAAKACRRVYSVDSGLPTWPVCHITDNTALFLSLLHSILSRHAYRPPSGKHGYYLAASGSVAWADLYRGMARALARQGVVDDDEVRPATNEDVLAEMGAALGCPKELVPLQVGGLCTFTARNGAKIGWKPRYRPEHILEVAQEEVDLILAHLKD